MENASKALIIAGAVLIALLLISVGIMIFSGAEGLFGSATVKMSEQEKNMFNKDFTMYEGKRLSGSQVEELKRKVDANNANLEDNPEITVKSDPDNLQIKNAYQYTAKCEYENGIVTTITVKQATDTKKP